MKVHYISCGPTVNESERKAIAHLTQRLSATVGDGEWYLLANLPFSATKYHQSDEIDIVAIGPPGVQVVEVKHWTATWVKRNYELVEREAERVMAKARKIGTTLRKRVPDLPRVDGVFLVTETTEKTKPLEERVFVRGVPFHTLKACEDCVGLHKQHVLSPKQVSELVTVLEPRNRLAVDGTIRKIAGYANLQLQTPKEERFHRVYNGIHTSRRDRAILHLYDLSTDNDPKAEARAEREWQSLHRLQQFSWVPRIIDSFQDVPGYMGELKFFTVADPVAPSISERAHDSSWKTEARLQFARETVRALAQLHDEVTGDRPMVHRNLTPETIRVRHDNMPIFTGFEYARIPDAATVASAMSKQDWDFATPPEIRTQGRVVADRRSDVYALCASLLELFMDKNGAPKENVVAVLEEGIKDEPENRISLNALEDMLSEFLEGSTSAVTQEPLPMPARYWTEDQIVPFRNKQYRIVASLGSGGVGTAFKVIEVEKNGNELGTYVAKTAREAETGERILHAYKRARPILNHAALSNIFEYAEEWSEESFVALMTWVKGVALNHYCGVMPLLAEELGELSDKCLARRWLRAACEALRILHDNNLIHGDLSPANMIVSDNDLVLTDYDCVTKIGEPPTFMGTTSYCVTSSPDTSTALPSNDFFALAASIFHVLYDREPFLYHGILEKGRGLNWSGLDRKEDAKLVRFFDRATDPNPKNRFASADEAIALLVMSDDENLDKDVEENTKVKRAAAIVEPSEAKSGIRTEPKPRQPNEVPWLKELLQSYPGSPWGNRETRGLDSDFADQTYVATNLENELYDAITKRRVRLVILCGNAGDGKTALLQHLADRLILGRGDSANRIVKGRLEDGLTVRMNLDGSAAWRGRSSDELLNEFLSPFQNGIPRDDIVHLLAINDGRLLEWVETTENEGGGQTPLTEALSKFLDETADFVVPHIQFINLNQRSLVGGISKCKSAISTEFVNQLVDHMYSKDPKNTWAPCMTCSTKDRCEVFRANRIFGPNEIAEDSLARDHARKRLFETLQAVHLRGETHITIRELRATLVYILFGINYCTEYHESEQRFEPYWDRAFSATSIGRQGDVLRELLRLDPGMDAHPKIDRKLLHADDSTPAKNNTHIGKLSQTDWASLASSRRRIWFEWTENKFESYSIGDRDAFGLAEGRHLFEFRNLAIFCTEDERRNLTERLLGGISRLEILPPQALERRDVVALRVTPKTPTETAFWIEKPVERFSLSVDTSSNGTELMERLHRHAFLIYSYEDGKTESLRLGADLFHLLLEINDGYQLGDVAADDSYAHLSIFVQRLVQEDHRRIFAWNPMEENTVYEIHVKFDAAGKESVRQRMIITPIASIGGSNGN